MKPNARTASVVDRLWSERAMWETGHRHVAGVDEVGRGALAGPLVAAAVIFSADGFAAEFPDDLRCINDSKLLSPKQRQRLAPIIIDAALAVAVGMVDVIEIDTLGIAAANRIAMERAVGQLPFDPDVLLLDAAVTDLGHPQIGLIDGDARCLSIAAASIVAKVTRDAMMSECHRTDSRYGFDQHKGYGTAAHIRALARHGPCAVHRQSFAPVARCATLPPL